MPDRSDSFQVLKKHAEHCAICSRLGSPTLCVEGERMVRNLYRTMLDKKIEARRKEKGGNLALNSGLGKQMYSPHTTHHISGFST